MVNRDESSIWPPPDFYLEVRGVQTDANSTHQRRRLQIWADGLVVYRQADSELPDTPLVMPLFTEVCAYRLDPASIRNFSRRLYVRRLYDLDEDQSENPAIDGTHAVVIWRAREQEGRVSSMNPTSNLDPVLNLVNSYLPEGRAITYGDLAGSPEVREVMKVPSPVKSLAGSLAYHRELADSHPDNENLQLDTFALAVANEDWSEASKRLEIIATYQPHAILGEVMPDADWQRDFLDVLRDMVKRGDSISPSPAVSPVNVHPHR